MRVAAGLLTMLLASAAMAQQSDVAAAASDDASQEQRLIRDARQLTYEGRRAGEGYFSADGTKLIFQSEREADDPFYQMYLMDLETGDVERVSPGYGKTTCGWIHPSGERVLFASTHDDPEARAKQKEEIELRESGKQRRYAWDYDEWYDIYAADLATHKLVNLTRTRGYDAEGSYSPDGKLIAFASNRAAYSEPLSPDDAKRFEIDKSYMMDIYIMNADGGNVRRLTDVKGYDGGPFFSPDGKRITWRRFSPEGDTAEIYTMNIDGSDQRQLTRIGAMSWAPYYHPSGKYIIFTTNKHGFANFELYLVDPEGQREPVRVTFTDGFDGLPVFSPDGAKLCWTTTRGGGDKGQLWLADWDHEAALKLVQKAPRAQAAATAATRSDETHGATPDATHTTAPAIRAADIRRHVEVLSSDEFEGRLTGSDGERKATQYVADRFAEFGLKPAGADGTWFQPFEFTAGLSLGSDNALTVDLPNADKNLPRQLDQDWRPVAFSETGESAPAEIVFAGYGIVAPKEGEQEEYDSYVHLDVKDKWVMVFRFLPEDITPERRQHLARYGSLRYKAMVARDHGAKGLIVVSGPTSKVREQLVPLRLDAAGTSLFAISISDALAEKLLSARGKTLADEQKKLDAGEPAMGYTLEGVKIAATIDLQKQRQTGRNVLARLSSGDSVADSAVIVVGAHVDHLGHGDSGNSLAREDERRGIHHGADDNASGVAAMLEIAENLADQVRKGKLKLKHDIIFAAWSGEELGLLGSKHFVEALAHGSTGPDALKGKVNAALNMDMVGRLKDKLILQGTGSSSLWRTEIEQRNVPVGLPITLQDDSYLPTDATSFYLAGVPILSAFTGSHPEYHTPRDTVDLVNTDGTAKIAKLMGLIARSLAQRDEAPDYVAMKAPDQGGARSGMRVYLGTIPDYGESPEPGVKLSGVSKGGPAEQAGVRGGDVIVELAGKKIENIYDYTYALDALKIGEEATIIVSRDGKRVTLKITPGSRQ